MTPALDPKQGSWVRRGEPRGGTPQNQLPWLTKTMFNMCFYPYGVHIIKVLALGPLLAILIFQGSQMTLMTTKMAMFFRHKPHQHPLMTPLNHCNNERPQISASVPPINTSWNLCPTHFVTEVRFFFHKKLMTGNWWLMIDHWSWMIDDW